MSGSIFGDPTQPSGNPFSAVGFIGESNNSPLMQMLAAESLQPGDSPSYYLCKLIYSYHPLGAKIVEAPLRLAMSQPRDLMIPGGPESKLIEAFRREWSVIGGRQSNGSDISADAIIMNMMRTARMYGISTLVTGERGRTNTETPIDINRIADADLYFNVLDPLNTAGSLVMDQDPNSPDFQKARSIRVAERVYHPSRVVVMMNESPIYIDWTNSAYGFVGRSAYQRALFSLKTYLQTMLANQWVAMKCGLLVAKMKAPGSIINNRVTEFLGLKRQQLKSGNTGNVLSIGVEEDVNSIDLGNLQGPFALARDNALKDIAMAAGIPTKLLEQEEMIGGMAEGTEDAKQIASYINTLREDMRPLYRFFDRLVMRRAWSPDFYTTIQSLFPEEYGDVPYDTALATWMNSFVAVWPNLLEEPDSEKMKAEEIRFKAAVDLVTALNALQLDPENKAAVAGWLADEVNARRELFSAKLELDLDALASYEPPVAAPGEGAAAGGAPGTKAKTP